MFSLFLQSIVTGAEGISRNKVRAFLTSLGIIFGVASVITMLSIGKGAEKQILDEEETNGNAGNTTVAITMRPSLAAPISVADFVGSVGRLFGCRIDLDLNLRKDREQVRNGVRMQTIG